MGPVTLYQKLRPFLRVRRGRAAVPPGKRPLQQFTGMAHGLVEAIGWYPGDAPPVGRPDRHGNHWHDRPTYEQFCEWYGLDPLEGEL